ncbi:hypothetical protein SKAU_G00032800 [Synaphobranchus kaupii]|uniref:Uncharacterized protein n=1 Tax=Synaphobranchus kaupii TaxID=118154 RepID=A0A9Q1GG41_SYNKA|nr:hypothetical protein SKAU_G00032800 [Synaphobranchus kaupii]
MDTRHWYLQLKPPETKISPSHSAPACHSGCVQRQASVIAPGVGKPQLLLGRLRPESRSSQSPPTRTSVSLGCLTLHISRESEAPNLENEATVELHPPSTHWPPPTSNCSSTARTSRNSRKVMSEKRTVAITSEALPSRAGSACSQATAARKQQSAQKEGTAHRSQNRQQPLRWEVQELWRVRYFSGSG